MQSPTIRGKVQKAKERVKTRYVRGGVLSGLRGRGGGMEPRSYKKHEKGISDSKRGEGRGRDLRENTKEPRGKARARGSMKRGVGLGGWGPGRSNEYAEKVEVWATRGTRKKARGRFKSPPLLARVRGSIYLKMGGGVEHQHLG